MPDTAALKLINMNIDSIQAEIVECKTNIEKELHMVEIGCANMDADLKTKQDASSQNSQNNANKTINYFFSSSNVDADKRKSSELMQEIHIWGCIFMALGALRTHFLYSLSQTANCIKCHPGVSHMCYKNYLKRNWSTCRRWTSSAL